MARISTHSATVPKSTGKQNRFKNMFKAGHSDKRMCKVSSGPSPASFPLHTSSPSGIQELRPGFEKIGLHPTERSDVLKVDVWENLKEENNDLSHAEKMRLYKEQQDMKKQDVTATVEEAPKNPVDDTASHNESKAFRLLGIEGASSARLSLVAKQESAARAAEELEGDALSVNGLASFKDPASFNHAFSSFNDAASFNTTASFNDSASINDSLVVNNASVDGATLKYPQFWYEGSGSDLHVPRIIRTGPVNDTEVFIAEGLHPSLRRCAGLSHIPFNEGSSAFSFVSSSDADITSQQKSQCGGPDDCNNIRARLRDLRNLVAAHEARVGHSMLSDIDRICAFGARAHSIDDILGRLDAALCEKGIASKIAKIGPFIVKESSLKDHMPKIVSLVFTIILFIGALRGPRQFITTVWVSATFLLAYAALRNIAGWNTVDASDVVLEPVRSVTVKAGHVCLEMLAEGVQTFMFARDAYFDYRMHKDMAKMAEHEREQLELECKQGSHKNENVGRTRTAHGRMSL